MDRENVLTITSGITICIVLLGFFTMLTIINHPTEYDFSFNLNITHDADNNTKEMYESISQVINKEIYEQCPVKIYELQDNGSLQRIGE
jgi:hypothetical protein